MLKELIIKEISEKIKDLTNLYEYDKIHIEIDYKKGMHPKVKVMLVETFYENSP